VRRGPPHPMLCMLVAPVLIAATLVFFATGVALLVLGQTHGALVGLHKASSLVWLGAGGIHVLAHLPKLPRLLQQRVAGTAVRVALVACTVLDVAILATTTLPAVDRLQDLMSAHVGLDAR
jgi:hypothetical protein